MDQNRTQHSSQKPTIYPTLVVGVGGMGTNTVRAVKRRLRKAWGGESLPAMIQLLALDTEPLINRLDQEPLYADETAYMGKFDATRLVDNLQNHPEIARWWDYPSIPLGYIHNGAKQLRPIGRLSFFRNYVTFKRLLETKYAALDKIRDLEMAQNRRFPVMSNYQLVYVVSSLCGGTGAGMFMDVAHRVRALVRSNARVVGIFFLPDVLEEEINSDLQRRRIKANAYAALKELNYFQETQQFQELYPSEQRALPDTPYAPFDFIFLLGRTNRQGRSLARKADAENLAAHLIQLTAISHLSSEILGLEVNVVRERMSGSAPAAEVVNERKPLSFSLSGNGGGSKPLGSPVAAARRQNGSASGKAAGQAGGRALGNYLVYSSFAASAIVAPDESLLNFWQHAFLTDCIRRLAAGPERGDPRQPISPESRRRVLSVWQGLLATMRARYLSLDNDRLEDLAEEVEQQHGAWHGFKTTVDKTFRSVVLESGLRGALTLADLIAPLNPSTAPNESLVKQRLFLVNNHPVTEEDRARWRSLLAQQGGAVEQIGQVAGGFSDLLLAAFNPRQARDRARDIRQRKARTRLHQRRDMLERILVERLFAYGAQLRELFRSQIDHAGGALGRANRTADRAADRIDPRIPDGTASTNTYYELETGAVGREYLQHFYRNAAQVVYPSDWEALLGPVIDRAVNYGQVVSSEELFASLTNAIATQSGLLNRVLQCVDIRHIIGVQHGQEARQSRPLPNNRIQQWLDRLNPYIRWDSDRFSFHDANLEHIRLAATPSTREDDAHLAIAMVGKEDIKWIPTGDTGRMDAVWIVHGLPVTLIDRLDEFRAQYENERDFPAREEFHLHPAWADLPEITEDRS